MARNVSALSILPGIAVLWRVAHFASTCATMLSGHDYLTMAFGSLIGGLGTGRNRYCPVGRSYLGGCWRELRLSCVLLGRIYFSAEK
jgi:hypothetical protein